MNELASVSACRAWWRLEPDNLAADSKGEYPLTLQGNPGGDTTIRREGEGSLRLQAQNYQYASVPLNNQDLEFPLQPGQEDLIFSCTLWWRSTQETYQPLLSYGNSLQLYLNNGRLYLSCQTLYHQTQTLQSPWHFPAGFWYHLGLVYQRSSRLLRLQWFQPETQGWWQWQPRRVPPMLLLPGDFHLGTDTTHYLDGWLDEVTLWNIPLHRIHILQIALGLYRADCSLEEGVLQGQIPGWRWDQHHWEKEA